MALTSAVLLVLSFPSFNQPWCAWIALVPWLVALRGMAPRQAFGWSYLVGLVFFLGSLWWLIHLWAFGGPAAILGWLALAAYLALYFGAFGVIARTAFCLLPSAFCLLSIPAAWVACEYLRSHLLSGFGWNLLAYSQTPWRPLIQVADLTGAWGVSFLIVLVNAALAEGLRPRRSMRARLAPLAVVGLLLAAALGYGVWRMPRVIGSETARLAVVQGNIPQEEKWDAAFEERILARYETLTKAAAATGPDLIVWPETSVPGFFGLDEGLTQRVSALARTARCPLLVGAPVPTGTRDDQLFWNSALLLGAEGALLARHDKLHLVPFGEFIPGARAFPWLRLLLPPIGDFVPGNRYTVFPIPMRNAEFGMRNVHPAPRTPYSALPFSVLICFEDIFPELSRRFVREGARLLLVITNDAWFGPTAAAYQHAQASIFRAVELRVPVARAANTGWSGCIDATGRALGGVRDATGAELFVAGTQTCEVPLGSADSLYRRWGDWFAWLCLLGCLGWAGFAIMKRSASFYPDGFQRPDRQPAR